MINALLCKQHVSCTIVPLCFCYIQNTKNARTQTAAEDITNHCKTEKTIAEEITEAATIETQKLGFAYDENSGLYYDCNTGYYYNAVSFIQLFFIWINAFCSRSMVYITIEILART